MQILQYSNSFQPSFSGASRIKTAEKVLSRLTEKAKTQTPLNAKDEKWLAQMRKFFGADSFSVNNPDNPHQILKINSALTIEKINGQNGLESLINALKTMIAATKYKPAHIKINGIKYTVHNRDIAKLLKGEYDEASFSELMHYLNGKRIFDLTDNVDYGIIIDKQRGIAKTCGAGENWEMSDRAWITDIMRVGDIQKYKRPESWTQALNTIGEYYHTQSPAFQKLIAEPSTYRTGGNMQGIPHIFLPKTLEPDINWFNNKRLESHGLALKEFCIAITDGLVRRRKYGYSSANDVPNNVIEAINNLVKYFKAIDYPTAPSAGNWEEIPLKGGLTSDTEAIRSALSAFRNLMFNPKYAQNAEIQKIRTRISSGNSINEKDLSDLIERGQQRVRATYLEEAPKIRPNDASLAFITTSDIKLSNNIIADVKKHMEILTLLEQKLVRENGIIRYSPFNFTLKDGRSAFSPDSYLNLNYFIAADKNGKLNLDWKTILDKFASKDCSEPDLFFARAKLSTPDKEAQWFMVSEISTGYGKQIEKILTTAQHEKRKLTQEEKSLIKILRKKQTEFLNRALARISDKKPNEIHQLKANGLSMPAVTVSEAHQYVSDINGKTKMMQGTNAPLAWALASLYKALQTEHAVIKKLNNMNL